MAIAALAALALAPNASAESTVLAELPYRADIDALNGWVVWSAPVKKHYVLRAWHDGVVSRLPGQRPQAYDFDLGTDLQGGTVATYTRCRRYSNDHLSYWASVANRGCRIRVLDLATGEERAAGEPRPRGMSHRTPAMWRGRIAYGESRPFDGSHDRLTKIRLWSPGTGRVLTKHHGTVPVCRYSPCTPGSLDGEPRSLPRLGWTVSIDLGEHLLAFTWGAQTSDEEKPIWEERVEDSRGVRRWLAGGGVGEGQGSYPLDPSIVGDQLWFGWRSVNAPTTAGRLYHYTAGATKAEHTRMSNHIESLARDDQTFYAVIRPKGSDEFDTCTDAAPCTLARLGPTVSDR